MKPVSLRKIAIVLPWLLLIPVYLIAQAQTEASVQAIEFFEQKIRPVLVERCYMCHSERAPKVQGGLLLDTREGLRKGGNSGAAIVPGEPEKSLLIKALRYQNKELQMPPGEPLAAMQLADLDTWIKMGAPDPRTNLLEARHAAASGTGHRLFQPPRKAPVPVVGASTWAQNPIDSFVLARLEREGLHPSAAADQRTLIRRATYDLIGLPPTLQEIEAFVADSSSQAFEKVVDRLLASPHYGERWGRHWLDVARYADTKTDGGRFPFAYTYRDWVIQAFNDDMPYDQFLMWQIAADRLQASPSFAGEEVHSSSSSSGEGRSPSQSSPARHLAALGFVTMGRDFPNSPHEMIDDRIDVVTRGMLGLTVSCARCHDHKYDPIPTKDYYSLFGVFSSAHEPRDLPLLARPTAPSKRDLFYAEGLDKRRSAIADYRERRYQVLITELRTAEPIARYLLGAHDASAMGNAEIETFSRDRDLNLFLLRRWREYLALCQAGNDPVFAIWNALAALPEEQFASKAQQVIASITGGATGKQVNQYVAAAFAKEPPASLRQAAERYGSLVAQQDGGVVSADPDLESLRLVLRGSDTPMNVRFSQLDQIETEGDRNNLRDLRLRVERMLVDYAYRGAPARAMALVDDEEIRPAHVLVRGNPNNPGTEVPRQFLSVLSGEKRVPFRDGSGRLELARCIAAKDNPLTARVLVNRVWHHLFGAGLVRTLSDFGLRGEPPTHPELLDYLAIRFMEGGWSVKNLQRQIVLSRAYQQSSRDNAEARRIDPENRLLWRMNRRRLDFEALRDSVLVVSGQLDRTMGGLPVSITSQPATRRRSVYAFIDRARLPGVFQTFDFASPDQHSPQRFLTTIPQQALFMMNSPFVTEQAQHLAARPEVVSEEEPSRRIRALYRIVFGREAGEPEIDKGLRFLEMVRASSIAKVAASSAWQLGSGEYDAAEQRVKDFQPFRYFTGDAWQPVSLLPANEIGSARLTADGGEAGDDGKRALVRRWISPLDGTINLSGTLRHRLAKFNYGDGVRARVVSSRGGELASWTARGLEAETQLSGVEVKPGDTIDFVVDGRQDSENDAFTWAPVIESVPAEGSKAAPQKWSASADFRGPDVAMLTKWEQYAQVLLETNEFAFVE